MVETIQPQENIFAGTGCSAHSVKTWTRFDATSNVFEIYPAEMSAVVGVNSVKLDRKSCSIRIPYRAKPGYKITITQVDLNGEVDLQKNKKVSVDFLVDEVGGSEKNKNKSIESLQNKSGGFLFRENKNFETGCGTQGILVLDSSVRIVDLAQELDLKPSLAQVKKISLSMKSVRCTQSN